MCLFLVIVGLVMYYLNTRIKTLESSVAQQNMMMSDVVASIRKDVVETDVEVVDYEPVPDEHALDELMLDEHTLDEHAPAELTLDAHALLPDEPVLQLDGRLYVSEDSAEESDTDSEPADKVKETEIPQQAPIYKNMKVDELRKLIQESDLAPTDGVTKLKKQDMIDILSN